MSHRFLKNMFQLFLSNTAISFKVDGIKKRAA